MIKVSDLTAGTLLNIPSWRGSKKADEIWAYSHTTDLGGGICRLHFTNGKTALANNSGWVEEVPN